MRFFEEFLMSASIIVITAVMIANVIGRVFLQHSISWAEEVCTIGIIIAVFVGVSYCARRGQHILMSALFDAINQTGKKIFILITSAGTCAAMLYLTYLSGLYVYGYFISGRTTVALRIALWIPYLLLPISFILTAMQYFLLFVKNTQEKSVSTCLEPLDLYRVETSEEGKNDGALKGDDE